MVETGGSPAMKNEDAKFYRQMTRSLLVPFVYIREPWMLLPQN